jgi:hypothetical protein
MFGQMFGCGIVTFRAATFSLLRSVEICCTLRNFKQVCVAICLSVCLAASSLNVQEHVSVRERSSKGAAVGYWCSLLFRALGHNHPFQQRLSHCDTFRCICIYTYHLLYFTYSMEQSPSWEAYRFLASQEIFRILWNPKVRTTLKIFRHLSLSWARSIQSMPPSHFLMNHLNIILPWRAGHTYIKLSSHLCVGLPSGSFPQVSPPKPCKQLSFPHTCYIPHASHSSLFDHPNLIWGGVQIHMYINFYKLLRLEVGQMMSLFWLCYWAECLPPRISLNAGIGKPATAHATRWRLTYIFDSLLREVKPLPLSSVPLAVASAPPLPAACFIFRRFWIWNLGTIIPFSIDVTLFSRMFSYD